LAAASEAAAGGHADRLCPVLAGPTAVGKTGLVTGLAARLPIEVISLDSRQIYRGLRIGTAQPTAVEQAACPHHLVDFLPPEESYSAQRFRADFERTWQEIVRRGHVPVLVGGAGFYLRALTHGFLPLPDDAEPRLPAVRDAVAALAPAELDAELARVDPASARRLHPNDRYRRRRALEVFRLTGRSLSSHAAAHTPRPALGLAFALVRLELPVAALDARIARRTAAMLDAGWVQETAGLLAHHAPDCPGLRSIGYAEIVRHLQGELPAGKLPGAIVQVTRQYAKRQRTWFRGLAARAAGSPQDPAVAAALHDLAAAARDRLADRGAD